MKWAVLWKPELSKLCLLRICMHGTITFRSRHFLEINPAPCNPLLIHLVLHAMKGSRWCNPATAKSNIKQRSSAHCSLHGMPIWLSLFHTGPEFQKTCRTALAHFSDASFCTALAWNLWTVIGIERGRHARENRQAGIWSMRLEMSSSIRKPG